MRKVIHCPLTQIPIPIIVGSDKEMIAFLSKHEKGFNKTEATERIRSCDAMVVDVQYNGLSTWAVYFRYTDVTKGVLFKDLAHETFHLWGSLHALMYGNDFVQYHTDQDEECAYHFARLFDETAKVIAEADSKFQKQARLDDSIHKQLEQNEIKSEGIPFIAIDGTDKTAEEIIAELREKST